MYEAGAARRARMYWKNGLRTKHTSRVHFCCCLSRSVDTHKAFGQKTTALRRVIFAQRMSAHFDILRVHVDILRIHRRGAHIGYQVRNEAKLGRIGQGRCWMRLNRLLQFSGQRDNDEKNVFTCIIDLK